MLLCPWHKLPEQMRNDAVKPYYDILAKKKLWLLAKRLFDLIIASLMLLLLSPLFIIIALVIKLDSKGSVFFRQTRVTANCKLFKIIKFRTMCKNAEQLGTQVTIHNDMRVTRVGNFLRKFHLDELPQLINIITGEMSFVGTRPEVVKFVRQYTKEMYATFLLPAGLTSECSNEYIEEEQLLENFDNADKTYINEVLPLKMKINLEAIKKFNLLNELFTIINTVLAVIGFNTSFKKGGCQAKPDRGIFNSSLLSSNSSLRLRLTMPNVCNQLSVLMSVYKEDKPEYLDLALQSIFNQTLKARKVVLVKDGKLTPELEKIIEKWQKKELSLSIIPIELNRGLAFALNQGLKEIDTEYIARMDTDDICLPTRFEKQIKFLEENKNIDVCGTFIQEINENNEVIKDIVKYPVTHRECFLFFARRDPMAHPTVIFRKSFFNKIGTFYDETIRKNQDTALWHKGFLCNCKFSNIPEVLFMFRRTTEMIKRRADTRVALKLLKEHIHKNKDLKYGMYANLYAFLYFCFTQMPVFVKNFAYQRLR